LVSGFKDSNKKFHPISSQIGVRKKLEKTIKPSGINISKITRKRLFASKNQEVQSPFGTFSPHLQDAKEILKRLKKQGFPSEETITRNLGIVREAGLIWDNSNVPSRSLLLHFGFLSGMVGLKQEDEISLAGFIWKDLPERGKVATIDAFQQIGERKAGSRFLEQERLKREILDREKVTPDEWDRLLPPYQRWEIIHAFDLPFFPFVITGSKWKDLPDSHQNVLSGKITAKEVRAQ